MRNCSLAALVVVILAGCAKETRPDRDDAPAKSSSPAESSAPPEKSDTSPKQAVVFAAPAGEVRVAVEVVSTPGSIQRGLMYRKHLAPNSGMLFVFPDERVRSFWMKNTLIPLDMIFVRTDDSVAGVVENAEPLTLESRSIGIPTQYVVEVNAGFTAEHDIGAGTMMKLEGVDTEHP